MNEGPFKAAVARGRPFAVGQSGNPGGKPKTAEVSALARRYTIDAIRGLVAVARLDATKHDSAVVAACKALLDLGYPGHQKAGFGDSEGGNVLHLHLLAVQAAGAPQQLVAQLPAPSEPGAPETGRAELAESLVPDEWQAMLESRMLPEAQQAMPDEALPLWDAKIEPKADPSTVNPAEEGQIAANFIVGTPPTLGFGK